MKRAQLADAVHQNLKGHTTMELASGKLAVVMNMTIMVAFNRGKNSVIL